MSDYDDAPFCWYVAKRYAERGLSANQAAKIVGVDKKLMYRIFARRAKRIRYLSVCDIAAELGVDEAWLHRKAIETLVVTYTEMDRFILNGPRFGAR